MTQSITGLGSGLDTAAIIASLMQLERQSQNLVKARATKANLQLQAFSAIREQLSGLRTAALALRSVNDWRPLTAVSSNPDAVAVSAGTGTFGGNLSFTVDALATAGSSRSINTITGTSTNVAADAAILVAAGGGKLGFATFASDDALELGAHKIEVTQASSAATKLGDAMLDASTVITAANNTIELDVNGTPFTLTIAEGTYTRAELAAAIQTAANNAGAALSVTVDQSTNAIAIATAREGSQASLRITGGSALATLKLSTDAGALTGTDGKVRIGDAPEQTISLIEQGGQVVLDASVGTITATFAGGLRTGSVTAKNVSVGDGSLATVVANINAAGAGVTATAVQVGNNVYRLQITGNTTGAGTGPNLASSEFGAVMGGFVTLTEAADARITVGSGPGAYEITSSTNTIANIMPGVTATLKSTTTAPVTVTASRDANALADRVEAIVNAYNKVRKAIDAATAYNAETRLASPLTGDATVRRIVSELSRALSDAVPWASPGSPGLAGVSVDKTGQYSFDRGKFTAAFESDPEGMMRLFIQGGTATDSQVEFVSAGDRARAGTYAVVVTAVATRATTVGLEGAWPIGAPQTVRVKVGSIEASYTIDPSDTQQDVVDGLNAAIAAAGLPVEASISGTGIQLQHTQYGSAQMFSVAWDGSTWESFTGSDVEGTINGVAGVGAGQQLTVPFDDEELGGLAIKITATSPGALGDITYQPGIAARLMTALFDATDSVVGYITTTEKALKARVDFIDRQVESMEVRLQAHEARLRRQFAALEVTLGSLRSQGDWLSGQIISLNRSNTQQ